MEGSELEEQREEVDEGNEREDLPRSETEVGVIDQGEVLLLLNARAATKEHVQHKSSEKESRGSELTLMISEISLHCSCVGSIPVGLCAQACKRTIEPLSILFKSFFMPSKSRPTVFLS